MESDRDGGQETGGTHLTDLPIDVLRMIGERLVPDDGDVAISARDAASCALTASRACAEMSISAWRRIERVAEAVGDIDAYRRSWGAENATLRRFEVMPLAHAACGSVRGTTPLWRMHNTLRQEAPVGTFCPIRRPAALFVLHVSRTVVAREPHPPAFRDRDLSRCPTHGVVRGRALVRLRDALGAPRLDVGRHVRVAAEQNDALDTTFREAGFERGWRESDLEARQRVDAAERWADRVDAQACIAATVKSLARRGAAIDFGIMDRIVTAYKDADVPPTPTFAWSIYTWESRQHRLLGETRGDIYARLQQRELGAIQYTLDCTIMPTLATSEIEDTRARLLAHALAFEDAYHVGGDAARSAILGCRTLDGANAMVALVLEAYPDHGHRFSRASMCSGAAGASVSP